MARGRKRLSFAIRFLLVSAVILALAGPESHRPNTGLCTIFLLDRSDSVSDAERRRAEQFVDDALKMLGENDSAAVIAFAKDARVDSSAGGRRSLGQVQSEIDRQATDIAAAVRLASASFPEGKARRIVVLSDGNETSGDALEAAQVAATESIQLDFVALGITSEVDETLVTDLQVPSETRIDQPFEMRAIVDSTKTQTATLVIDRDGVVVKQQTVRLQPGRNRVVISDTLREPGFFRYRATLKANNDRDNRNNVGQGYVAVRGKPKVLILQQNPADRVLADAITKQGINVVLAGPGAVPVRPEDFQTYDAVLFNDINAASMTEGQMKVVRSAVEGTGIGFAMIGGEDSFLPGGYYGSPIAEMLPVDLNIRQRKSFPSTSISVFVDASGSMAMVEDGHPKIRLAAKAAEETVRLLSPLDRVGVAGSTDGIEFVAPMQRLANKDAVISQVRKLDVGGGGIYMYDTMVQAAETMRKETTKVRHIIVLADGADADKQDGCIPIALQLRAEKITTSIVAIGDGPHVPFLKQLAAAGGGRFYLAKSASQLPAIFTQDAAVMSRSAIEEGAFIPKVLGRDPILRNVASGGVPPLLAYCLTDSRPLTTVSMRTNKDDPLFASWQYGLGTSLAFTSDAKARWAQQWVGWEGFGAFWAQVVRGISRRAGSNNYQVSTRHDGARGIVEVDATDALGNPIKSTNAKVKIALPDGTTQEVSLLQTAPGKFSASFDATELGTYIVTVVDQDGKGKPGVTPTGFSLSYPPEYRNYRANQPLLERLSAPSGGQALANPADALRPVRNPGTSITELWPMLMMFAALLLPVDIGVRRIALPLGEILAKIWAKVRSHRRERMAAPQVEQVGRLQQAKRRAQTDSGGVSEPVIVAPDKTPERREPIVREPVATGGSSASKLLESKRRRQSGDQE